MNDKTILPQKEKNYVDTLHLSCNIEDFIAGSPCHVIYETPVTDYRIEGYYAYKTMLSYLFDTLLDGCENLGTANGRSWYKVEKYTLGIMDYDKAKTANQYNCVIQYNHSHIFPLNQNLDGLELPFDGSRSDYKIKRIDLTKTAKLSTDYTIEHGYISPYRSHPLRPNRKLNTVYLGKRENGNVFRMYPKTIELLENKDFQKIALYSEYFGDIENLYSFELELTRKYLKECLGIDTLADLPKVWEANKNIVGRIRFFKDTPKNRKLLEQNNSKRIKALVLTDYVDYDRVQKKAYKPSYAYLKERIEKDISKYLKATKDEKETEFYMRLVSDLMHGKDIDGKELTFYFENSDLTTEKAQMTAKYKLLRDNQTNELELEANRAFKKIEISHINSSVQDTICHQEEVRQKEASPLSLFSERV